MNDTLKATGDVDIKIFENEILIDRIQENNLVVTLGKTNIAKLLGGDAAGKPISKIAVGDNGLAASVGDVAIANAFSKAITGVSYPDAQSVLISFDIANNEANGMTIREFGLLNADNVVCARKVRDADIVKTNVIRLVGTWKITIN
jgi:hypothetical protein